MKEIILWIILIFSGFLFGSVMFSRIIPQITRKKDISELSSDKNPGAANVFKNCGVKLGLICLLLDMLKGFMMPFIASMLMDTRNFAFSLVMTAPVIGHALGMFNSFKGGKCISTSFGVMLGIMPVSRIGFLLAIIYVIFSVMVKINPHMLRSIISFSLFAVLSLIILPFFGRFVIALGCLFISLVAIVKHVVMAKAETEREADELESVRK